MGEVLGFSKKRFFITLGLSVLVWLGSMVIQFVDNANWNGTFSLLGSSCEVTGYPLSQCLLGQKLLEIVGTYLFNIFFWFFVIHLFWGFISRNNTVTK